MCDKEYAGGITAAKFETAPNIPRRMRGWRLKTRA